ncbi:OmpH family outer membrane protein [Granulicella sp. S190]|uniref:OmpH family outer membrane protein n=1 Tax=Granulicella sp. S190 TaxID=1747226 RepID=UPI00131D9CFC|nr:OmpH family outer membrane protein [Granulicella sp. S190]
MTFRSMIVAIIGIALTGANGLGQSQNASSSDSGAKTTALPPPAKQVPEKIGLVAFEQGVFATNEGQRAVQEVQAKYKRKKDQLAALSEQIDSLKAQLNSASTTLSTEERAAQVKNIEVKERELNHESADAQNAYNADLQAAYGEVAKKFSATLKDYVSKNGYTLLLDVSGQQNDIMWANQSADVTEQVVEAYNASSGVPPPSLSPSAPSTARPRSNGDSFQIPQPDDGSANANPPVVGRRSPPKTPKTDKPNQ